LVDARADLYSIGCVLYELVAGSAPFVGTARAILDGHLHRAPPSLAEARPGVPAWLDHLTAHLLAKSPGERVAFAADVAEQLLRYAGESPELNGAVWRPLLYRARPGARLVRRMARPKRRRARRGGRSLRRERHREDALVDGGEPARDAARIRRVHRGLSAADRADGGRRRSGRSARRLA